MLYQKKNLPIDLQALRDLRQNMLSYTWVLLAVFSHSFEKFEDKWNIQFFSHEFCPLQMLYYFSAIFTKKDRPKHCWKCWGKSKMFSWSWSVIFQATSWGKKFSQFFSQYILTFSHRSAQDALLFIYTSEGKEKKARWQDHKEKVTFYYT